MSKLTRRRLLCATAPLAAVPLGAKLVLGGQAEAAGHDHAAHRAIASHAGGAAAGHAAMIGEGAPAVGGANDLDALLYPPAALPHKPGRVREYTLVARDEELEIAPGVFFPAWTYNGTVPGPVIRATEGDILRVRFANAGAHPHTIHFHGIHPTNMDGVFEIVGPGEELHVRVPGAPCGVPRLPLPLDPAQEAHPQGSLRRLRHRPQGAARACPGARPRNERVRHGR